MVIRPYALAACAVLPLVAPDVWSGFRLAQSDPVLSVIAPTEQPLSVRSPGAVWAVGLALTWLALAYWRREVKVWEAALVLVGSAFILARLGNAWVYDAAILLPLAHKLRGLALRRGRVLATAAVCLLWALVMLVATRP